MIIVFLIILAGLISRNILVSPILFYDWDEGMYAQIAKEIIKNKSLFTTFNGEVWLDKPPLVHSLIAFIFSFFGQSEFWTRMIMVITAFILLVLTYLLAQKLFKNRVASLLSVLVLTSSPIFLERSTLLNSDIFIAVSWLGYFLFWNKYWPKLFFLTLGVWSKSILGFYPLFIDFFNWLLILFISKKQKLTLNQVIKSLVLILIPSLWYIAGLFKFRYFFIENHFLSQMLKRLYVPIELHFGNKFFYFSYLWQNLGLINILFILGYLILTLNLLNEFRQKKFNIILSQKWLSTIILLSPLPFLMVLTIMKTKITWYVVIFLPFLTLLIPYLYTNIKSIIFKYGIILGVMIYFVLNFIPQTFFLKVNYSPPEKIKLAQCLSKTKYDKIAFLVDEDERKVKNFLEAAHYNTTSSFFYGGSPSFVYYVQKKVNYYYDINKFIEELDNYSLITLSKKDANNQLIKMLIQKRLSVCQSENWLSIVK